MFEYLSVEQVMELHDRLISHDGGLHGIRSHSLLESAVFRMRAGFGDVEFYKTIFEKAAALFESLCKNHPFIDGNKRTAFASAVTFLLVNGYKTFCTNENAEKFVLKVASGKIPFKNIVNFFRKYSRK